MSLDTPPTTLPAHEYITLLFSKIVRVGGMTPLRRARCGRMDVYLVVSMATICYSLPRNLQARLLPSTNLQARDSIAMGFHLVVLVERIRSLYSALCSLVGINLVAFVLEVWCAFDGLCNMPIGGSLGLDVVTQCNNACWPLRVICSSPVPQQVGRRSAIVAIPLGGEPDC